MPTLRPYQIAAVDRLREQAHNRPCLVIPTGGGKTTIAAEIIRLSVAKGHRCIFLVHRRELVEQAVQRLSHFGIEAGRILAGTPESRAYPVQVASIPTLIRREHWPADLVFVDEASHAVSQSWRTVIDRYHGAWIIGLTATPIRLDGTGLGDIFGSIVEPVTTQELVDQGYLIDPKVWAPPLDLSSVRVRRGDYDLPQLAEKMDKLTGNLVDHWHEHAFGMKTVAFAVNVDHSLSIVERFKQVGVRAAHLGGATATHKRAKILRALDAGLLDLVSSCMVLSEGWDMPALQCAILARPTKSLALFRQMVGRVMRPPGPVVVLDHAGNHHEHGPVTETIQWSLEGSIRRPSESVPTVRQCFQCYALLVPEDEVCPECGWVPVPQDPDELPGESDGELEEFVKPPTMEEKRARYAALVMQASVRGRKLGWAKHSYKAEFGVWPRFAEIERELYSCPGHEYEEKRYGPRRVLRCGWCLRTVPV